MFELAVVFVIVVVWLVLAFAVGAVAKKRGRSPENWTAVGLVLGAPLALLFLIALPLDARRRVPCSRCAERIIPESTQCHFCGKERKANEEDQMARLSQFR